MVASSAHPVPRLVHDRTITVRVLPDRVVVEYRLELDEWTAFNDLVPLLEKEDLAKLASPKDYDAAFVTRYGPILADNLTATLDGKELKFACVRHTFQIRDSLECDYVFEARWQPSPGMPHRFTFREGNYELEAGAIRVSLTAGDGVALLEKDEPDAALKERPEIDRKPGDEARLRRAGGTFRIDGEPVVSEPASPSHLDQSGESQPGERHSLLRLLLDSRQGFWMLLALAALFGAAHALTPGHGKTLVAAYLVGERGTLGHALVLGLVTTLTHTGAVLILAALLPFVGTWISPFLGLLGGLLVAGMGVYLLLSRLTGAPDHVHIGGGHHHQHTPPSEVVGWWGLIVLGVSGGIVPCWDAIAMLAFSASVGRLWLGLPLLLAFSAGLAGVLVAIGVAVVYAKGLVGSRWSESRLFRALPLISAFLVTALGVWLCYDSVHP